MTKIMKTKNIIICGSVTLLIAGSIFWFSMEPDAVSPAEIEATPVKNGKKTTKSQPRKTNRYRKNATAGKSGKAKSSSSEDKRSKRREALLRLRKNYLEKEAEEIAKLSPPQRELYSALQKAIDAGNDSEVLRIIRSMQSSKDWPQNISPFIKHSALNALFAMGEKSLSEIIPFMADSDSEIVEEANSLFVDSVSDMDLSDYYRAELLVAASKAVTDVDTLESLLFELNSMRNSVAVDAIKQLLATGNSNVQQLLPDAIETFVGEEGIKTPEQLDEWLKQNPDDENDDDFYGKKPQK